jgi:ElaB/YqjD/DUF883 family membrane-anchored ribosome-binding protein
MAQTFPPRTDNQFDNLKEQATSQLGDAAARAQDMANRAADQGREAGRQMGEVASNFKGAIDQSLAKQPMATLGVAAMVGFVLGAIWKS